MDTDGYECELIGATAGPDGRFAYVESRRRMSGSTAQARTSGTSTSQSACIWSIPRGSIGLPISSRTTRSSGATCGTSSGSARRRYSSTAKHWTFACRLGDVWPPRFVKIEDRWVINGNTLGFIGYKEKAVRCLRFPGLEPLEPISVAKAKQAGLHPGD